MIDNKRSEHNRIEHYPTEVLRSVVYQKRQGHYLAKKL